MRGAASIAAPLSHDSWKSLADLNPTRLDVVFGESKHFHQVADCRAVHRYIGITRTRFRVWQIVAAPVGDGLTNMPVGLDEFVEGDVVVIGMYHAGALRIGRHHYERNPRPVAEEIYGLNVAGIVEAAPFIEGDHHRGILPYRRVTLNHRDNLLAKALEQVELR